MYTRNINSSVISMSRKLLYSCNSNHKSNCHKLFKLYNCNLHPKKQENSINYSIIKIIVICFLFLKLYSIIINCSILCFVIIVIFVILFMFNSVQYRFFLKLIFYIHSKLNIFNAKKLLKLTTNYSSLSIKRMYF